MTDTFTASNGIEITMDPDREGKVYLVGRRARGDEGQYLDTHSTAGPEGIVALREFFQHERDEALERWRWPEKPEWVVYAKRPGFAAYNGADLLVINELHGASMEYSRALDDGTEYVAEEEKAALAARAYFKAHPERKPWEDAKAGDVWVIEVEGTESFAVHLSLIHI